MKPFIVLLTDIFLLMWRKDLTYFSQTMFVNLVMPSMIEGKKVCTHFLHQTEWAAGEYTNQIFSFHAKIFCLIFLN